MIKYYLGAGIERIITQKEKNNRFWTESITRFFNEFIPVFFNGIVFVVVFFLYIV